MLTKNMNRFRPTVGRGTTVVAAAVMGIVLTVLTLARTVFSVHADQTEWAATRPALAPKSTDDTAQEHGGGYAWV